MTSAYQGTPQTRPATGSTTRRAATLLAAVALAQMLVGIDYNIVFVALPQIAELGFGPGGLPWVISAYAVAFGGLLLLCGRLVDRYGRRRLFMAGVALFALGSVLGGAATSPAMLVIGRAIQGAGGAALSPAILALLGAGFPEGPARNRALGIWGAAGSAGMVLGSILGGVLTQALGWRAVFFVNVPLVAAVVVLAWGSVPPDRPEAPSGRLDLTGGVLATAAAGLTVAGFTFATEDGWSSRATWACLGLAALVAAALVIVESRAAEPLFRKKDVENRHLVVGTASTFLFMAGFGALAYFVTIYLQDTRGLSALSTGLIFVVPCAGVLIGTHVGGRLATRGLRVALVGGNLIGAAGLVVLAAAIGAETSWAVLLSTLLLLSVGQGIVFTGMFATAATGSADDEQGTVGGIATTGQQLGGAVGLAVLVTLTAGTGDTTRAAVGWIAAIVAAGAATALLVPRTRQAPAEL
ncbi:MFS transporter [Streptomyces roseolilacinus]|uniref:MFS transporter n=1 Tax=Streptomyces roseolilacinus TaxID=66904 RepID=A0A918AYR6_9ACTN|nr:MFS transporter [Streptomyces roseolilacinus]GGP92863.1 MFS transporter [Streptomyces roseolilacinus]